MTGEYITPTDFRGSSLAEFCSGLELTDAEAETSRLTATIARCSQRFDNATNDHFSSETPVTMTLHGDGTPRLELPRRTTALTSVAIVNWVGTSTVQASTVYRLHPSLDAGAEVRTPGASDYIDIIPGQVLSGLSSGSGSCWPTETNSVVVIATTGWTTTPADVKRAVALLVYAEYKPQAPVLSVVSSWNNAGTNYQRSPGPFGIPVADDIAAAYQYGFGADTVGKVFIG